jgi:hypothetical protein
MTRLLACRARVYRSLIGVLIGCLLVVPVMEAVAFAAASDGEQAVQLSKKEKQQLVQAGVAQYEAGNLDEAQKILSRPKPFFPKIMLHLII